MNTPNPNVHPKTQQKILNYFFNIKLIIWMKLVGGMEMTSE